jgi:type II secretory pathway predicted ATPase ExeA
MSSIQALSRIAFSETSDPDSYVPREATESALREIGEWADSYERGSSLAAIVGTPGLGKTLLLRLIEARAVSTRERPAAIYLPYAGLSAVDLCHVVYGLLGEPLRTGELVGDAAAIERLLQLGDPAAPFFLLLDDADSMPVQTVNALIAHVPSESSPVRILLALNPDSKANRLLRQLYPLAPRSIGFRKRLTDDEAHDYLQGRMRWAGFPQAELDAFESSESTRLNALSSGIPRRLHALVSARFAAADSMHPRALIEKQRREDWMGQPLDDDLDHDRDGQGPA